MSLMNFMERNNSSLIAERASIRRMRYLMGTFVEIEAGSDQTGVIEIVESAFSEIKRIEYTLSKYLRESEISRINRSAGLFPVEVNLEVFKLLEESVKFSHLTNGAFDISVGAIMELWGLAQKRNIIPADDQIRQACLTAGYTNISLNCRGRTVFFKNPDTKIDLGGIGKGYAVDKAIDILKKNRIKKALINAGGNIFCLDEDYSNIGIKDPLEPDEIITAVFLKDKAISTSANYERSFSIGDKGYGHLVDPETGYPASGNILSVSIISSSAKIADILSTAVFILGEEQGMKLIENTDDAEGIIIVKGDRKPGLRISSGLNKNFRLKGGDKKK